MYIWIEGLENNQTQNTNWSTGQWTWPFVKVKGATPVSDSERVGECESMSPLSSERLMTGQ